MASYTVPGLYREEIFLPAAPSFLTGVPVFLGYAGQGVVDTPANTPQLLTEWPQFATYFGAPLAQGYLADAVYGFFANDGLLCYVIRLAPLPSGDTPSALMEQALAQGLAAASVLDNVDLVCAPDIMWGMASATALDWATIIRLQCLLLDHCQQLGDRLAILDGALVATPGEQRQRLATAALVAGADAALYYPWLWVAGRDGHRRYVPPCGHVAGVYARSDQQIGVHKAPANEPLNEVLDLHVTLSATDVGELYAQGVNCLLALPGRGIRVWGARTLSTDPIWRYVNARRVLLTVSRWIERFMTELVYEPNDIRLWVRILRELTAYLDGLFQRGMLKGRTPEEAFFVKCDSETNPPAVIAAGQVVTQIGLALAAPAEFVGVRIIHGASGVRVEAGLNG